MRIQLLGTVRVDSPDGVLHEADLRGRRAVVLFARLAAEPGQAVPSELLAEAVWGWSPPASWPAALRNAIAVVRSALDTVGLGGVVEYARGAYVLDLPTGSTVDLIHVQAAASAAELALSSDDWTEVRWICARALEAAAGTFLPGPATPWVEDTRTEVLQAVSRIRRVAGEAALHAGDLAEAEAIGRRLVADAPLREDGHRFLMRALQAGGNTGEALRAYEACRRVLLEEVGATPSEATSQLFVSILGTADVVPVEEAPRRSQAVAPLLLAYSGEGFVGRSEALAEIARARVRIGEAGPLVVRIHGESGIGKTRLAAEAVASAYDAGLAILYGRADDRINVPYRPIVEAVGGFLATYSIDEQRVLLGDHAGVLARVLPSLRAAAEVTAPSGVAEVDHRRLASAIEHVLGLASAGRGVVVVLDDMHFATESTLRLLRDVVSRGTRLRVLVLVLHRTGSVAAGGLDELGAGAGTSTIMLGPLDEAAVAEMVRRTLGPALAVPPGPLAAELWSRTQGNPLLVSELLRSVDPGGTLELPARSERVEELVRQRVTSLPGPALAVLTVAAASGLEFDPEVIAAAAGTPRPEAEAVLAAARRDGLVVPAPTNPERLAFRHAVVHESLVASLDESARMELHRRLGMALEQHPAAGPPPSAALAYHFDEAAPLGEWRRAVRYLLRVARTADEEWMPDEALTAGRRALAVLEEAGDPDPGARIDALTLVGRASSLLGEVAEGAHLVLAAFDEALATNDPARAARAALALGPTHLDSDVHLIPEDVLARCEEALELLGDLEPSLRARLLAQSACAVGWSRGGDAGRQMADDAVILAREIDEPATLVAALRSRRRALSGTGAVREQRTLELELLPLASELGDLETELSTLACQFETAVEAGEGPGLEGLLDEHDRRVASARGGHSTHLGACARVALALLRDDLEGADRLIDEAADVGRRRGVDPRVVDGVRLIQLAGVRRAQGRLSEVRFEIAAGLEATDVPEWQGAVAAIDAELGDLDSAAKHLEAVFERFVEGGLRPGLGIGHLAHLAAPVVAIGDLERAHQLYDLLTPHSGIGAYVSYFDGPIDWHLGLLGRALGQELAAQAHLRAAEQLCHTLGAPRWTARCADARS